MYLAILYLAALAAVGRSEEPSNRTHQADDDHPENPCKSSCSFHGLSSGFSSTVDRLVKCAKEEVLRVYDLSKEYRVIEFNKYISFVKDVDEGDSNNSSERTSCRQIRALGDDTWQVFLESLAERMDRIIRTRSIVFKIYPRLKQTETNARRRHYKKAFPMMVAGFMMMSAFLVPLGFQFMAMIGGKALLLSKMAFMMSMYHMYRRFYPDLDFHPQFDHPHDVLPYPLHRSSEVTGPGGMTGAFARPTHDILYKLKKG